MVVKLVATAKLADGGLLPKVQYSWTHDSISKVVHGSCWPCVFTRTSGSSRGVEPRIKFRVVQPVSASSTSSCSSICFFYTRDGITIQNITTEDVVVDQLRPFLYRQTKYLIQCICARSILFRNHQQSFLRDSSKNAESLSPSLRSQPPENTRSRH